jgi:hypothetical protein
MDGLAKGLVQLHSTMFFTTTVFSQLVATYPTWEQLLVFLTSPEGGSLRVITSSSDTLAIIRYTKDVSDFEKAHVPFFRSVIWDTVANRPVSVAPVKALQGNPETGVSLRVTDFVDGTMFHAFCVDSKVRIATRTSLDAGGKFYSTRTFAELFGDAVPDLTEFLSSVLENGYYASFVLQHPEHRTVQKLVEPRIYVTYYGKVSPDGEACMSALPSDWPERLASYAPQVYEESIAYTDSKEASNHLRQNPSGHLWQGLVFQDIASSRRWRLRNPAFVAVRALRGGEANPMERFLRLRDQGLVKKYLEYFREESDELWKFEQTLRVRTQELYTAYNEMNKLKTKTMKQLPYCLRPHVYALHGAYLGGLPKDGSRAASVAPVLKETVVRYVNSMALPDLLKFLQGDRVPLSAAPAAEGGATEATTEMPAA